MTTKYRGFLIEKIPGFDCRPPKKGEGSEWVRVETKEGTTYDILDPLNNDDKLWTELSFTDAKDSIDDFLNRHNWKANQ